jgi:hypothetical protein
MHRIPIILTVAMLGAVTSANAAEHGGAAPSRSTTIAEAAPIQDATSRRPVRKYRGARPKNPDQIVENIGIDLPAQQPARP